jgi:hypothetical protein
MGARATSFLVALAVAGCGMPDLDRTIWLPSHPDVEVRCDGGQEVPADVCAVWAEEELANEPDFGTRKVTAIKFTFRGGQDGRTCSVEVALDGRATYRQGWNPCPGNAVSDQR